VVEQKALSFGQDTLTIKQGAVVEFKNGDDTSHNIIISGDGVNLNSGLQQPGVAFSAPMIKKGRFEATCGMARGFSETAGAARDAAQVVSLANNIAASSRKVVTTAVESIAGIHDSAHASLSTPPISWFPRALKTPPMSIHRCRKSFARSTSSIPWFRAFPTLSVNRWKISTT
jgi:hypothetical protein